MNNTGIGIIVFLSTVVGIVAIAAAIGSFLTYLIVHKDYKNFKDFLKRNI